ncbi:hypothetical protein SPRG_08500 [Saprolegnia parasitica CBS 223.65]|uniref:tRNA (carboxymethyluridine(34)-5-O)-methyltransferase n=1 Tax=Saprolegnia parasitica (strain CBS 223.65) TaxID=695850 RepID=A0A067C5V6_SAPPC|nr:hypothetical protein SPRG_08500 [Saprolegnia parasitica CBS 223.65]KDO26139.1 hypothetical protein SPRG_08500 [Saprolegnia parasitica CBS 223.65]|eukprot:XP_012203133.1 hypothetical protein SPRG_08500 [Saprolegnia parasitica CBS 223.65]
MSNTKPRKPKNPEAPTRYLYVANCTVGGDHGVGEGAILSCFGAYGTLCDLVSEDAKGYLLVTFATVEAAVAARSALQGTSPAALGGRKLFVQFAAEAPPAGSGSLLSCPSTTAHVVVPGLSIIDDFISADEEASLLSTIDGMAWEDSIQRRVQHYGYAFRYDTRDVDASQPLGPLPPFCADTAANMHCLRPDLQLPDQITINEYLPGQGIAPHVDTADVFTEYIASLSLGSDIVMDFRLVSDPSVLKHVVLKRRSLCLMVGEARYLWKHGIAYRKHDLIGGAVATRSRRVSLTLRKILDERDVSRVQQTSVQRPTDLEKEHVHGVYDSIASHFSHTRHHPWPLVTDFLNRLPDGALVADIGCGNGKYLGVNPKVMMIGSDRSMPLLSVCSERTHEVFGSDGLSVPLRTGVFDAAICIAVLHHMSTIEHRLQILRELARLVRVGSEIYVVAWAFEQDALSKRKFASQDVMVEWKLQQKYIDPREPLPAHVQLDDAKKWAVYKRYCHVYRDLELELLVRQVPGLVVTNVEMMRSNWCVTIERV